VHAQISLIATVLVYAITDNREQMKHYNREQMKGPSKLKRKERRVYGP